jgi:hypothetical protein
VILAVTGQERHGAPADLADHDGADGAPNGVLTLTSVRIVDQLVEAAAAEDAYLGPGILHADLLIGSRLALRITA